MRYLFVSPHPDDVEIGCGGIIHKAIRQGHDAAIAICTGHGDLNMVHSGACVPFNQRREEQINAAMHLGNPELVWLGLGRAACFDTIPQAKFVTAFDQLFPRFDQVYLPLPSYNADHERVWKTGLAAFRPGKLDRVGLFAYEQLPSNSLADTLPLFGRRYIPLDEIDVEAKSRAIECHFSQMGGRENSIYGPTGAAVQARARGLECGKLYAEMVLLIRDVAL